MGRTERGCLSPGWSRSRNAWSFISSFRAGATLSGTTVGAWLSWLFAPLLVLALVVRRCYSPTAA